MLSILTILKMKKRKKKLPEAVVTEAVVLSCHQTGLYINGQPQLKLQLQVLPDSGRNFVAEIISVSVKEMINAGARIRVSFNPANHREIKMISAA
jgi:hypothetical protein